MDIIRLCSKITSIKMNGKFLVITLFLLTISFISSGCLMTLSNRWYANDNSGVAVEIPIGWKTSYYRRGATIFIKPKSYEKDEGITSVEIYGSACGHTIIMSAEDNINANVSRLQNLYSPDTVIVDKAISRHTIDSQFFSNVHIIMPTNPDGENAVDVTQGLYLFDIRDNSQNYIMVLLYEGKNEILNDQALKIIESIKIDCNKK